ncbi:HEAT repeat protein [Sodiomyces alkalinus F11]|uniref:HEAT repeat protein n=1 Tax=Sodiomyces alkalinus (strain CBS 110278 / VKM F-3762 / F11) TaxID=1314773 RepID=A0A3N2Q7R1_SODAK|nr:HEAT repeat protein [Sodiomyces alkalinus F11]ROT42800.1 HEAT repeat protein [Sodiomyces alkalinus F11]
MTTNNTATLARNELFKQLKPCCVPLSQIAIRPPDGAPAVRNLTELVEDLSGIINRQVNRDPSAFDDKLADYVFFPLSHVFRNQNYYPARTIEVALRGLTTLIVHGWKSKIAPQIVEQLLILLTFIVGGVPGQESKHGVSEETSLEALRALTALITAAGSSAAAAASLVETKTIPALGHTVTVVLQSVVDGKAPDVQAEALRALQSIFTCIKDHAALASFLPGVVSSLTRLLSTPAREKTRVLVAAISALKVVLVSVLSDLRTRSISAKTQTPEQNPDGTDDASQNVLSPAWLKATVSQIKLALATVLKLRASKSQSVRDALGNLCLTLLDECHTTLENCAPILVESAIILEPEDGASSTMMATSLQDLATIYPELGESAKVTVYSWITSLPRIMQSADESHKQTAIRNLLKGTELVTRLQLDSSTLNDAVSLALRDSISFMVADGSKQAISPVLSEDDALSSRQLASPGGLAANYQLVVMSQEGQLKTRSEMLNLIAKIGSASQQVKFGLEMLDYTRELTGPSQVASYWLSFELVKAAFSRSSDVDDFLDLSSVATTSDDPETALQEVYTFAVSLLDSQDESTEIDWRLEAIALEVTAYAASRSGEAFRPELIDVLYPVTTFLGSPHPRLREHAITTLNIVAASCGYTSVSELIIENVDYMVNSVSLRMNTLDITPASTKVLTMMTRLTGSRLIPYLDDVVASIFAALDNYHGYPVFVESLFAALKEIVEQGAKSDRLLLQGRENGPSTHKKHRPQPVTIDDLVDLLDRREERRKQREEEDVTAEAEAKGLQAHPQRPWGPGKNKPKGTFIEEMERTEGEAEEETRGDMDIEKEKPPKTPTYTLLEKVAYLTQHYLTSPAPTLRKSLLDLLTTVSPALSPDEDAFLPLINAVWPVVVARLYDGEPFVVLAACDTLGMLCRTAGDFLASRIKTEWWDALGKWCREKKQAAVQAKTRNNRITAPRSTAGDTILVPSRAGGTVAMTPLSSSSPSSSAVGAGTVMNREAGGGLGKFASAAQIWEATVRLLVAIVSHVRIEAEMFDEVLGLLADRLERDPEVREALETINPDAVWFALYELGVIDPLPTPVMEGVEFPPMKKRVGL